MALLDYVLQAPTYGWERDGKLYKPSLKETFTEFFSRMNVFANRKNFLALFGWGSSLFLAVPLFIFLFNYLTWKLFIVGFIYSMVILGTHGTIWYHRYSTHRAYVFTNRFWRFITANLVVKIIPEETYVVSHYVHHAKSEEPGDPYNVNGGWWYCFLADVTHQGVNKNLSPEDFHRVTQMLDHTGVKLNTYAQYQYWGCIARPWFTLTHFALNWAFWYTAFYLLGGHALATCIFGSSCIWAFGVRTFNFDGHGGGKDKRKNGIDFYREDHSINQLWPGLVTGEWHNNHHLYANGARAGFLPYQLDYAWYYIKALHTIGAVKSYKDYKPQFMELYYKPYLLKKQEALLNLDESRRIEPSPTSV